jgi:hypothetical protein
MYKETSYFRGILGAANSTLVEPAADMAGEINRGSLLTLNSQTMRVKKGTDPEPLKSTTFYQTNWSHPADTAQATWVGSGTVTVTNGVAGTGRWVWLIRNVTNFYSDFQMNDFSFNSSITDPANTSAGLNAVFEMHAHDANFDDVDTDTQAEIESAYDTKINNSDSFPFQQITSVTTNSQWNTDADGTPSSGTGLTDGTGVFYVYYEASGTFTGGNNSFLRTEEMTYTSSPTLSFSYVVVSTTPSAVGGVTLYWVTEQ